MGAATPAMWVGLVLAAMLLSAQSGAAAAAGLPRFAEAPEYRNGEGCPRPVAGAGVCDPGLVHIAMTLDAHYLRGSMAAIYSLLKHAVGVILNKSRMKPSHCISKSVAGRRAQKLKFELGHTAGTVVTAVITSLCYVCVSYHFVSTVHQ